MKRAVLTAVALTFVAAPTMAHANGEAKDPLYFDEVARSVEAHDPRIRQALERLRSAEGEAQAARGAFDPRIEGDGKLLTGAYYDLRNANVELRQPTTLWGSEIYAGYRVGLGLNGFWPTYRADQTLSGGEVRAGIEIPIWRGGPIDQERAARARTQFLEDAARRGLSATELDLELGAARAYWGWVSAGQSREVAKSLLQLAEERDAQLRRRLEAGSIAEFDVTDNERILFERRALLVSANRALEKAAFELSLFLRDADGRSELPDPERLPPSVEVSSLEPVAQDQIIERVLSCHPEVERARAELEAVEIERRLARNRLAPELFGFFQYSRDLGELTDTEQDFTLPGNVYEAGVVLSMPLLFRTERGRAQAATAQWERKRAEVQFIEDQLRARTRDAASAVRAAHERAELAEGVVETASELAEGERRRFEVGASNLIFVNLREQQAAFARMRYIEAVAVSEIEKTRWETTVLVECR